jgi:thiamine biosynthesis protein ThiI
MSSILEQSANRVIIVRYGEVSLKGMNRPYFEKLLLGRVYSQSEKILGEENDMSAVREDGLIVVRGYPLEFEKELSAIFSKIFGVASVSVGEELVDRDIENIKARAIAWMENVCGSKGAPGEDRPPVTYKVFGKRADKAYPITSPDMAACVGGAILEALGGKVRVDVRAPEVSLYVHLRKRNVFIYDDRLKGLGGLPLGTNGKGVVLLSGGIDSPVATWMMAKRGMTVEAVHFHSYPFTSLRSEEKVKDLVKILAGYCGGIRFHSLNLLPAQEQISQKCPEAMMTILIRRFMMRIAEKIALRERAGFLITGENLGQVASQTADSIAVTDKSVELPVMRPLIGMDKVDIIAMAQDIGTYETSILPYEDCCTVFLPRHPNTSPVLSHIEVAEEALGGLEAIEDEVLASETVELILP